MLHRTLSVASRYQKLRSENEFVTKKAGRKNENGRSLLSHVDQLIRFNRSTFLAASFRHKTDIVHNGDYTVH